ncbi:cation-translocating P-type ATPase [Algoriphagus hitonicola]|uniref:Ca2+-transporting ATPase n=1 Tax=Algoriphagus hitonicola TaxID=435880 RepID=A0A1I2P1N3_9BACT|nr:cation-translocating P-type ATPase [Algoriphagus hitonicola]SFG10125.1 Ca2+-transporting ATPase [Algoriphagus hitonicola]
MSSVSDFSKFLQTPINQGLSQDEISERSSIFGKNTLKEKKKKPAWKQFLGQFQDFMILILLSAALISGVAGDLTDSIIILIIVVLNAVMGFVQEYRAEKALESLKKMSEVQSQVRRSGQTSQIPSSDLVPGDIILLEAGNMIPADIQLLEAFAVKVDEASLTGESIPVEKTASQSIETHSDINSTHQVFKGTVLTNGRAVGIVLRTGMDTQLGKIADLLQNTRPETPLQNRMKKFSKVISYLILLICLILFGMGILRGEEPLPLLLVTVSLAVAAIPEALPALITIALSLGAARLAKKEALIRKLPAVESLGSITYICSDKTGTLTKNEMTVVRESKSEIENYSPDFSNLHLAMALNHDIKSGENGQLAGEATELALVHYFIKKEGKEKLAQIQIELPRIGEIPFDSERKRMSTFHSFGGKVLILCKGATESIIQILKPQTDIQGINSDSKKWASEGERVLAFAAKIIDRLPGEKDWTDLEADLDYLGIAGMIDPPREEVKAAIEECKTAGIKPVMITGDHPETAKAIAKEVGILEENDQVLTGKELLELDDEKFEKQVENIAVYARVAPDQKLRIVKALQKKGHYVAMTGDGVNDAPSLRASTIGVAMGITGTDVSKEAAHMILLDDNFATIVRAIHEGRRIFDNIRKFIKYIMTCNGAEIWTIAMAPILGLPIPLLPIHILWINLVTDGVPALALAGERPEKDIMNRPPRPPQQSLFADGVGIHIIWVGILMAGVTLFTQYWAIKNDWHWQTMVFTVLAFSQLGHVMAVRSDRTFLFRQGLLSNAPLLLSVFVTLLLQLMVIYLPFFNELFHTEPLNLTELIYCAGMGLVVFHAVEIEKWVKKLWQKPSKID